MVTDTSVLIAGRYRLGHLLAAAVRRVEGVVGLRDQMRYTAGTTTECTALSPQLPWPSRAVAALALALR